MKQIKRFLTLGLTVALGATTFTGCTAVTEEDYSKTVVATYGDQKIYLDEANFDARYYQYMYERFYSSYYGSDFWSTDAGSGTMEDNLKENVMSEIMQTYVLMEHADEYKVSLSDADKKKVSKAVKEFLDTSDEKLIKAADATEHLVTKVYTNNALANKVWEAVVAKVDTNVTDEEARQVTVKYVLISESNNKYKDGEKTAKEIADKVKAGKDLDTVCKDYDSLTTSTESYSKNGENDTDLGKKAATLSTGDITTYQVKGTGWYVISCTSDNDKDAAKEAKTKIIDERKDELFNKIYTGWSKKKFKVEEDVWAKITFDKHTIYEAETTSANSTESSAKSQTETTSQVQTEASSQAQTETK